MPHFYLGPYTFVKEDPRDTTGVWERPHNELLVGCIDLRNTNQRRNTNRVQGVGFFSYSETISDSSLTYFGDNLDHILSSIDRNNWRSLTGITDITGLTVREFLSSSLTTGSDPQGVNAPFPLMPNHNGFMEIWTGGRGRTMNQVLLNTDPWWPKVLSHLNNIYVEQRTSFLSRFPAGHPRRENYLKILGAWRRKYRRAFRGEIPDYRIFLGNAPDEGFRNPETSISDNYDRADNVDLGADWTEVSGSFSIVGQEVGIQTLGGSQFDQSIRNEIDLSIDDHESQITITVLDAHTAGLCSCGSSVRNAAAAEQCYASGVAHHADGETTPRTFEIDGGTETAIGIDGSKIVRAVPFPVKTKAEGSSITRFINGVSDDIVTDTTYAGQINTGANGNITSGANGGAANEVKFDNFIATDLLGGSFIFMRRNTMVPRF